MLRGPPRRGRLFYRMARNKIKRDSHVAVEELGRRRSRVLRWSIKYQRTQMEINNTRYRVLVLQMVGLTFDQIDEDGLTTATTTTVKKQKSLLVVVHKVNGDDLKSNQNQISAAALEVITNFIDGHTEPSANHLSRWTSRGGGLGVLCPCSR